MTNRDPLPIIRKVYRQHADRAEISASFLAEQAMLSLRIAAADPSYRAELERHRVAAADWLSGKFSMRARRRPGGRVTPRDGCATNDPLQPKLKRTGQ